MRQRYLFAQCLEAARCLEQGVISDVRDGDVGVIMAVGFPAFTGGPFTYIENYGLPEFVRDADALSARYGERFEPPSFCATWPPRAVTSIRNARLAFYR